MATLEGIVLVDGLPKDGVTVRLFPAGAFGSPPVEGTAFPVSAPTATTTSGPSSGKTGGYRFSGISSGVYYAGMNYLGLLSWDTHDVPVTAAQTSVKTFGAVGDGITNDTAAIQAALNDTSVGALYFPPGTYLCGNVTITNRSHLIVEGQGATLKWTGTAGAGNQIGIQLTGTVLNLEVRNLHFLGDGVAANGHAAVWWKDGATVEHLRVEQCRAITCVRGVSGIRSASGTWRDIQVNQNEFVTMTGTGASQGEGVYLETNQATTIAAGVRGNYFEDSQRYDVHLVGAIGVEVIDNHSRNHRATVSTGATVPCFRAVNVRDVSFAENLVEDYRDGAVELVPTSAGSLRTVSVRDNKFIAPANAVTTITVGSTNPAVDGFPDGVQVRGNTLHSSGIGADLIVLLTGKRVWLEDNLCYLLALAGTNYAIRLDGTAEGAGTANYTDEVRVERNTLHGSTSGGAFFGVRLSSALCTSGSRVELDGNRTTGGNDISQGATVTDANLLWARQKVDGLGTGTTTMHPSQFYSQSLVRQPVKSLVFADSPYAVLDGDEVLLADATGGAITINLPPVAGKAGRPLTVVRTSAANSVVVDGNAAETIDAAATKSLDSQYAAITIVATGAAWFSVSRQGTVT